MASEQWLFDNATAVAPGGVWTAVGSTYSLRNIYINTIGRTTSNPTPYQGAGCVADPTYGAQQNAELWNAANTARIAGTVFYTDCYYFTGSQAYGSGLLGANGNDTYGQYLWTNINNTTASNRIEANWYDVFIGSGALIGTAAVGAVPTNAWVRVQSKFETWGISSLRLFVGSNINGTSPDYTLTWGNPNSFTSYENANGMGANATTAWDDLKVDTAAYPTRSTAQTISQSTTVTATGTATISNAKQGTASGSETATGTATAVRGQSIDGTASITASATAGAVSTQRVSGTATVTATGTATALSSSVSLVTVTGSATVTATGTVDFVAIPLVTVQTYGNVTGTAESSVARAAQYNVTAQAVASGTAGMTRTYYIFTPPSREISPISLDPYAGIVGYNLGKTLVRRDGVWKLVQNKRKEWLDQCEYVFFGGRDNHVNVEEKAALEEAGYTVEMRTS